jgi:hypothetical protein
MGHTLLNSNIIRLKNDGTALSSGNIMLRDAFFNPLTISFSGGIDPFLKGMATQVQQKLDCKVIDDVRNFLFGIPGAGGLDLAAINIARGRERGLPDYNTIRSDFGLPRVTSFADICEEPEINSILEQIYEDVNNVDPWVGLLAEDHMDNTIFGETVMNIIERQFRALRDGDRFYFENDDGLSQEEKAWIRDTRFHDVIMRNTDIDLMQYNVFEAMPHSDIPNGPELEQVNLAASVFPNPVESDFKVKVFVEESMNITTELFNNQGKVVMRDSWELIEGDNYLDMSLSQNLPVGFYNLVLRSENNRYFTVVRIVHQ